METAKTLGILGGLGPMASVYFYELVTSLTRAECDQEHINIILSSFAGTPDRTAYILGQSFEDPTEKMVWCAKMLEDAGAQILAMPCNTAHYFYDAIAASIQIPMLNIIDQTLRFAHDAGAKKVGILATEGTIAAKVYQTRAAEYGIECCVPSSASQERISSLIYDEIKRGRRPDMRAFYKTADELSDSGCDRLILGCTELSLLTRDYHLDERFIDSMYALACATVLACGKELNIGQR